MNIIFLLIGLIIGALSVWFIKPQKIGVSQEEIDKKYVPLNIYEDERAERQREQAMVREFKAKHSVAEEKVLTLKAEIESVQATFRNEFKNLANELLEEKSKKFTELNEKNISTILNPLKEKIEKFEKKVEETYTNDAKDKASLKKELEIIREINKQMSDEAQKLTKALKGDSKTQGDWGEVQLEMLLEKSGLQRDIHYVKQMSLKSEEGKDLRPDYVINLPENRNFIIDSKVSLTAYENYFNAENEEKKLLYLKEHLKSINNHINELSAKNYQSLYGVNSIDYVFLFVAIEPALTIALQNDMELFDRAMKKNVVLVSATTLLATMRTVAYIWKQDNQNKNVLDIAYESGKLYDKFTLFIDDLIKVGKNIEATQNEYKEAMNKLTTSSRKGDTIVGRIERIKTLGANTTKTLPQKLLDKIDDNEIFPASEL
ncbi:MAG: DNA recombination protein RmuC [Bacteroidales bacterium]|jgi:DNA recombination protein RmuC|nr:DNA recombination protein RmuC [Bacteroidales bacterium]